MDDSTLKSLTVSVQGTKEVIAFEPPFSPKIKQYHGYVAHDVAGKVCEIFDSQDRKMKLYTDFQV